MQCEKRVCQKKLQMCTKGNMTPHSVAICPWPTGTYLFVRSVDKRKSKVFNENIRAPPSVR